ncbi:MAG TPA: GYD domain-containing protein [Steroidobacteraceae bacterium]|nr:GYD domain-containing protein [Steroidobacteraceae bacterium]
MPKYLVEATYTAEGLRGLHKDKASGRKQAVVKAVESLEGRVEAFYYAMGERDVVVIAELPDALSAAALSLAVSATGLVRASTTALLSTEEIDRALSKKLAYRGPGA